MIRAILIDDEINAIKSLEWEVNNFSNKVTIIGKYTSPFEAIEAINNLKPDCVFLDIEMPNMDGFQLLSKLEFRKFDLIITTAYDNYAIKAFKENAIDYLLKPVDTDDLLEAIGRIENNRKSETIGNQLQKMFNEINATKTKHITKIQLPVSGKIVFVEPNDILYCKAEGNYTTVYLKSNIKYLLSKKIKEIESIIPNNNFFRVHKSYFVNLNAVKELIKNEGIYAVLENGENIPISRIKKDELIKKLSE